MISVISVVRFSFFFVQGFYCQVPNNNGNLKRETQNGNPVYKTSFPCYYISEKSRKFLKYSEKG
jgi:hypothetical protein